jgi:DNA-binding MarR family transcriptional regulator
VLWRATLAWQREMRAALAPHNLTHVQFVLLASLWWLCEQGDPPTQKELADQAGTDAMMTSQVLRKLEAAGLVERNPHPRDSRARLLAVTRQGRAKLQAALQDVEAADARFFKDPAAVIAALS